MLSKMKYRLTILKMLRPFASGVIRFMLLNGLIGLIVMALGFIQPLFYKLFIDNVILLKQLTLMPFVAGGYISIFLLNTLFAYAKNYCTNRLVNRVTFRAKMKILKGFFARDFVEYDNQSVGDMKMRMEDDTACIADYAGKQTIGYATSYVTMIISVALLFITQWRLAIFACVGIPLTFWLDHIIAKREAVVQNWQRENDQKMSSWLHASVQGWREIKALNLQKHEERQFVRHIHNFAIYFGTWINYWVMRVLIIPKIKEEFLMRFCLYFFGGLLIIAGRFEIGSLLVFMQYYALLSGALEAVSRADAELLSAKPKSERLLSELYRATAITSGCDLPDGSGSIVFHDVTFSYPGSERLVLNKLSFSISKGERVAIVGKSGAGKTTALKLMLGLLSPTSGDVLFSDVSINSIRPDAIYKHVGFVMQENLLFNDSIKENLLYAKPNATDDELEGACRKAFILELIESLPDGMNTIIGERGIKLSGGQKQRLVLARQFLRDVSIFIFDEATSALDQYSESVIQDAIESIGEDKTIVVVAHRKSSLSLCDRVIDL
jgi:ATP-binding cassette subfamily B protein/subfamily B ATP-binding cassette protein MsbA